MATKKPRSELLLGTCSTSKVSSLSYWNYTTGNVEHTHKNKCKVVRNSMHLLGNDYVFVADEEKPLLHVWPLSSQEECKERYILPGVVTALSVDPTHRYLAAGIGPKVYIWHIPSGALLNIVQKHYQAVTVIKVTQEYIIVGGKDGLLVTYKLHGVASMTRTKECHPLHSKNDHTGSITDIAVGVFENKSNVASTSDDYTCRIYTLHTGVPLIFLAFDNALTCAIFDVTSRYIFVGESKGPIRNIHLQSSKMLTQHVDEKAPCYLGHSNSVTCLTLNRRNKILASASKDSTIIVWSVKSREQIHKISLEIPATCILFVNEHANLREQNLKPTVTLRPLQKTIATGLDDMEVYCMAKDDIRIDSEDEDSEEECVWKEVTQQNQGDITEMVQEVQKLRAANIKLFETAVNISRRYNLV